jgi:hypothetical protein
MFGIAMMTLLCYSPHQSGRAIAGGFLPRQVLCSQLFFGTHYWDKAQTNKVRRAKRKFPVMGEMRPGSYEPGLIVLLG